MNYAFVQARISSSRIENKIFQEIEGEYLLWHIINRIKYSDYIDKIIVSTTTNTLDNKTENWLKENDILYYRGEENDVLKRFYDTAEYYKLNENDLIIRITADDPFKDPFIIDEVIKMILEEQLDFGYNNKPPSFPEGLDVEAFNFKTLKFAYENVIDDFDKEHVTQYLYRNQKIKQGNLSNKENLSKYRLTVDEQLDLDLARIIYNKLYKKEEIFLLEDIINLIKQNPDMLNINNKVKRSYMYE